ncbi:MAG: hypothetical protein U0905_04610 [Pirellulales bacterium]
MKNSRDSIWAILDQGVLSGTRFLTTFLLGKFAVDGELGIYSLAFSLLILFTTIQESLITTPYQVFFPREAKSDQSRLGGNLLATAMGLAILGAMVLLGWYCLQNYLPMTTDLSPVLVALGLSLPFHLFREFMRRWQFVNRRIKAIAWMEIGFSILQVAGLIALLGTQQLTANFAIGVMGVASLVFSLQCIYSYRQEFSVSNDTLKHDALRTMRYGQWIVLSNLCAVAQTYFPNWYLASSRDPLRDADIYTVCYTIALLANPFLLGVSSLHGPQASRAFVEHGMLGVLKTVIRSLALIAFVLGGYTLALSLIGEPLAVMIFGEDFQGQRWPIFWLSLAVLFQGISYIAANGLCAANHPHLDLWAAAIGLVVSIGSTLLLPSSILTTSIGFCCGVVAMAIFRLSALYWLQRKLQATSL